MNNKKSLISKLLIGGGLLALICGIFCFFGGAAKEKMSIAASEITPAMEMVAIIGNIFAVAFGSGATATVTLTAEGQSVTESGPFKDLLAQSGLTEKAVGGITALVVIEIVIIVLAVILLVGIFAKKLQKKHITIGCGIICVLALVAVILAFCSKKMFMDAYNFKSYEEGGMSITYSLGSAGISYGVLGIVGILATGAGLFLGKDEAVAA